MKPKTRMLLTLSGIALLAAATVYARAAEAPPKDRIEVAGRVRAQSRTVVAPALAAVPATRAVAVAVSGTLATVTVVLGDHVTAGRELAHFDTHLLDLGVEAARAAVTQADASVGLVGDGLDRVADGEAQLADARAKLADGKKQLTTTRATLVGTRADLERSRIEAVAGQAMLQREIHQLESIPTTLTPQQQQILAGLKAKLAEVTAGIERIDAGLAKVAAGLAKIDAALAKLPSAERRLATARATLADARTQATDARGVLRIVADARRTGLALAQARRDAASLTAPESGVVTYVRPAGTVAMVGAPVVRLAPDTPQLIDTYLTAEQLARIAVGEYVEVRSDSFPGRVFEARVSAIGVRSEFPPTTFPTDIVHMTRTVRVTVRLEPDDHLPAGTPVDLTVFTDLP